MAVAGRMIPVFTRVFQDEKGVIWLSMNDADPDSTLEIIHESGKGVTKVDNLEMIYFQTTFGGYDDYEGD